MRSIEGKVAHPHAKKRGILFVAQAYLLEDLLRRQIVRHRKADNSLQSHVVKACVYGRLRSFGGQPLTPKRPVKQVQHFGLWSFRQVIEPALADEGA